MWIDGGKFTWSGGNLGYPLTGNTCGSGTVAVNGGTLQIDVDAERQLGWGINVGTGTPAGLVNLNNTGTIDMMANLDRATASQFVVGANGIVDITTSNSTGRGGIFVDAAAQMSEFILRGGSLNTTAGINYIIGQPLYEWVSTSLLDIVQNSTIRFVGLTGQDGGTTGTRGKSAFLTDGMIVLQGGTNSLGAPGKLVVNSGYQQDSGSLICQGTDRSSVTTWTIDAGANPANKILINGGNVLIGLDGTSFGDLQILTGGGANNLGLEWRQSTISSHFHAADAWYNSNYASRIYTDAKVIIGYQPGTPPNPPTFAWIGIAPPSDGASIWNIINTTFGITVYQNPILPNPGGGFAWQNIYDGNGWSVKSIQTFAPRKK